MKPALFVPVLSALLASACIGVDTLDDEVLAIRVEAPQNALFTGESMTLSAFVLNSFGDTLQAPVEWVSTRSDIAPVSPDGELTALAKGQTEIFARYKTSVSASLFIAVVDDPGQVAEVRVTGPNRAPVGGMITLNAVALNGLGQPAPGAAFTWRSDNPQVAVVAESGMVSGVAAGKALLFAEANGISSQGFEIEIGSESRMGTFAGLNGYRVSGTAFIENGSKGPVVRLGPDFQSSNGPGLCVYLSNSANSIAGGVEVARLRNNSGEDSYPLPAGIGLSTYNVVVIHCRPFNIPFGSATLN